MRLPQSDNHLNLHASLDVSLHCHLSSHASKLHNHDARDRPPEPCLSAACTSTTNGQHTMVSLTYREPSYIDRTRPDYAGVPPTRRSFEYAGVLCGIVHYLSTTSRCTTTILNSVCTAAMRTAYGNFELRAWELRPNSRTMPWLSQRLGIPGSPSSTLLVP